MASKSWGGLGGLGSRKGGWLPMMPCYHPVAKVATDLV